MRYPAGAFLRAENGIDMTSNVLPRQQFRLLSGRYLVWEISTAAPARQLLITPRTDILDAKG